MNKKLVPLVISFIFGFRMLGLFMIIPVLALQDDIYSNFNPFSLGIALGAYGFTQGILQIPFGIMSDKFGRKRLIYLGLVLFTIGSIVAATAVSMEQLILGRAIQGSGAISGTLLALLADTTGDRIRSSAMALVGMFIGGAIPFLVSSITMTAVGDAAFEMINEIRRQFREIPGILEGTGEPDTDKCVEIATRAALQRMMLPGVIAVSMPPLIGFLLGAKALGGMLAGGLLGCVLLALMMANAGGAWDNAKKYIEKGNLGGKGSDTHAAAVVGDTVGDPFKDTSGPAMNILINVMAIVSLVIAGLLPVDGLIVSLFN